MSYGQRGTRSPNKFNMNINGGCVTGGCSVEGGGGGYGSGYVVVGIRREHVHWPGECMGGGGQ